MAIGGILAMAGVVPIVELDRAEDAPRLAQALAAGGLQVVELTLRTAAALAGVRLMRDAAPGLVVGMGSIRTAADIDRSLDAGADFLVSPGASGALLDALSASKAPALPGVATASEAMTAMEAGFGVLKLFPAEIVGGIALLKALAGPLPSLRFCPTGGVSAAKAPEYLALENVLCVGGSWIAPRALINKGAWEEIQANAVAASTLTPKAT